METKHQNDIAALQSIILESPLLSPILHDWEKIALPDCWLVAGAIAQTVWNHYFGLPATHGIADIDIVYFDAADFSESAEAARASRIRAAFSHLPAWIDVRNEARVHLWYEARFACSIEPYTSVADAITTFPTTATAVGLQPGPEGWELRAPYGISDLLGLIVNCKVVTVFRNHRHWNDDDGTGFPYEHCAALSVGKPAAGKMSSWGAASEETRQKAEERATNLCGGDGQECKIREWVCT